MAEELPLDKLRAFLRDLTPEAKALLLAEIERSEQRGEPIPAADFLLQELRADARGNDREADRAGMPARVFFSPLEPFLVDDAPERPHRGRIARVCLEPIWQWISRDLMPSETKVYSDQVARVLLTNDKANSDRLARAFQDQAVQRIQQTLTAVQDNVKARQRLAGQVGTPLALDDLRTVFGVLKARDALNVFASRLPATIKNLADEQLDNVKALLDSPVGGHPDVFLYALILVMGRLAVPCQLVRLAIKAAETDQAARVAGTPYALAVTIVLEDMEREVTVLRADVKGGRFGAVGGLLKDIHDAARVLRTEMDLSGDSPWARQLATLRAEVSNLIKSQIEAVPGRMRRLLRPRKPNEITPGAVLDATEVADTEALIEFVSTCRNYASELALNEVTMRVSSELQNYLETGTAPLVDGLRGADDRSRPFRLAQVDAAVRFAGKVFGANYASLLAKAADVAAQDERKAAKG
jgi:hypothetical protein